MLRVTPVLGWMMIERDLAVANVFLDVLEVLDRATFRNGINLHTGRRLMVARKNWVAQGASDENL